MNMKTVMKLLSLSGFAVSAGLFLAIATQGNVLAAGQTPDKAKETCITASCHATMGKAAFVHGPVGQGDCTSCHQPVGNHKFQPIADVGKVCLECHEKAEGTAAVHRPYMQGHCTKCHDPHQSPFKFQLRAEGSDLCFKCHNRAIVGGKYVHGPAAVGGCGSCHSAHASKYPKLLTANGNDVCFSCHSDKLEAFQSKKFLHAPAKKLCVSCHSPHSSNYKYNLAADGREALCFNCHKEKQAEVAKATHQHGALAGERKCLSCHDPHATDFPKQLVKGPSDLCLGCHDRTYTSAKGKVENIKDLLAHNQNQHGPIKDCSGCHNAHGSTNFRMLRENFPQLFYAGYNTDNYKLCFMCHENTLASQKKTTTLTGFRNGDVNLHFVHVNKETKGRTCRACHDAHATKNMKHIRDAVPFGAWKLPVNYNKTATGGSCLPGCHKLYGYDRNKAVLNN